MTIFDYMKKSREKNNMTQEDAARKLDVSVSIIRGWEKDSVPDDQFWKNIINIYALDRIEFLEKIVNHQPVDEFKSNLPAFLFSPEQIETYSKMVLSEEEQELLGLEAIYLSNPFQKNCELDYLPYKYVKATGSFQILAVHRSLCEKLGNNRGFVIHYLMDHPDFLFNIHLLSDQDIKQFCIFTGQYDEITKIAGLLRKIEKNGDRVCVGQIEKNDKWNSCPASNEFLKDSYYGYGYNNEPKSIYPQYIEIIFEESVDREYLAAKEEYVKQLAFYNDLKVGLYALKTRSSLRNERLGAKDKGEKSIISA